MILSILIEIEKDIHLGCVDVSSVQDAEQMLNDGLQFPLILVSEHVNGHNDGSRWAQLRHHQHNLMVITMRASEDQAKLWHVPYMLRPFTRDQFKEKVSKALAAA